MREGWLIIQVKVRKKVKTQGHEETRVNLGEGTKETVSDLSKEAVTFFWDLPLSTLVKFVSLLHCSLSHGRKSIRF